MAAQSSLFMGYKRVEGIRGVLVAATLKTETLTFTSRRLIVTNTGTGNLYFTLDGTTPTVAGDGADARSQILLQAAQSIDLPYQTAGATGEVKMISSATPTYQIVNLGG